MVLGNSQSIPTHAPLTPTLILCPQEPENAHAHLLSMVLGNSQSIPVTGGKLALGTWQSVLVVRCGGGNAW